MAWKARPVDLLVLRAVFENMGPALLEQALTSAPTSAYLKRLWFFYEFLLDARLNLPDVGIGPYVDLLERKTYVTRPGRKVRRHRINYKTAKAEVSP